MCDSLGQSDQKIKVWKYTRLGQTIIFNSFEQILEDIKVDIGENFTIGDAEDITIECTEMYEHEFENLPEFDGY